MFYWLTRWFRPATPAAGAAAHMTFGQTSVGRSITQTRLFLKKQLWIWPIIAVVLLALIGWGVSSAIERTMKENLQSELHTLVSVERSMLETWFKTQESNAESLANDQQIRAAAAEILAASRPPLTADGSPPADSPAAVARPTLAVLHARLADELGPGMSSHEFVSYFLADKQRKILSSSNIELVGQTIPQYDSFLTRTLDGQTVVCPPFPSVVMMKDELGNTRTGVPTMFVSAPIRDSNFQVVAALALRIRPEREFTRILQLGRIGNSGETYAFDKAGLMVSNSRFDEDLIQLGLLPDAEHSRSILNISIRNPGGNMKEGFRPKARRAKLPLTDICAAAVSGKSGILMDSYNDYRGIPSVGAYEWLPKYDLGLLTEVDTAEAFHPLTILQRAFYALYALLTLSSIAIFAFTLVVARLQREAQKAAIEAKQLGQYRLETRLGAGAMGVVYKGHHAMLRRPTAIKMLNVDRVNDASIQRFEREVQITCKLNNPNTVAIYDYGRTPEGVFYYAMEYLDGIDLQVLVEKYGPQPEGRVISILQQVCGSLYEAHSLGLVHRDIKPANIMLNRRGGEPDVVKVLDFGLVKAIDDEKQAQQSGGMSGTPLYMSPEAIQTPDMVDARSDLYAVGAVGYYLLTGQPVFHASSLVELCQQHVTTTPDSPSQRLGRTVSAELESALLACLEKSRAKRPQTARDFSLLLCRAPTAGSWTIDDAEAWWGRHERGQPAAGSGSVASNTVSGAAGGTVAATATAAAQSRPAGSSPATTAASGFDRTIEPR
jgi:eukaryotic-like serine/threonine-protein kinase